MVRVQARALSTVSGFKASRGWLGRFMKWHSLSLHWKTTVCQKLPADCILQLVSFISIYERCRSITNTHVTACLPWMRQHAGWICCLTLLLPLLVYIMLLLKTTGHEKDHFTVILSAKADGTKKTVCYI